jgi:hypothetical protein
LLYRPPRSMKLYRPLRSMKLYRPLRSMKLYFLKLFAEASMVFMELEALAEARVILFTASRV